jgi:hypothetical protein
MKHLVPAKSIISSQNVQRASQLQTRFLKAFNLIKFHRPIHQALHRLKFQQLFRQMLNQISQYLTSRRLFNRPSLSRLLAQQLAQSQDLLLLNPSLILITRLINQALVTSNRLKSLLPAIRKPTLRISHVRRRLAHRCLSLRHSKYSDQDNRRCSLRKRTTWLITHVNSET